MSNELSFYNCYRFANYCPMDERLIDFFYQNKKVVKDVVLTISQAIGPMEQGVMKIQQTFQRKSDASEEAESVVEVETEVTGNQTGDENNIDV